MTDYRLYFIDREGHIAQATEFDAENDVRAIQIAEGRRERQEMELWSRDKRIIVIPKRR